MTTQNLTQIPAPRVPFIDERTNLMSREWYRFFINLFNLTGNGSNVTSLTDLQVGPPTQEVVPSYDMSVQPYMFESMTQIQSDLDALKVAPKPLEIHPIPYGSFFDTTTQTGSTTTPNLVTFNTIDLANGVYRGATTSQIYVSEAGVFNFQFSIQGQTSDASTQDINLWLRINGVDVIGSNGLVSIPGKHGAVNGHIIAGWNFFLTMAAGDYLELVWLPSTTTTTLEYYAAQVGPPAIPATYSAVLTAIKVNITSG